MMKLLSFVFCLISTVALANSDWPPKQYDYYPKVPVHFISLPLEDVGPACGDKKPKFLDEELITYGCETSLRAYNLLNILVMLRNLPPEESKKLSDFIANQTDLVNRATKD